MRYKNNKILINENKQRFYATYSRLTFPKKTEDNYITWADYHTTQNLAYKFFDTPTLWWVILAANNKKLESDFFTGEVIRIPFEPQLTINGQ